MAFNPFNVFRRNQKILFSILTVIVMIMFIFSTGLGRGIDFFDWMPNWISSKRSSGDVMAEIDGNKVRASELGRLQDQRDLANQFMAAAHERATVGLVDYLSKGLTRVTPGPTGRDVIQSVLAMRPLYVNQQQLMQRNMMAQMGMGPPVSPEDILTERELNLVQLNNALGRIIESKKEADVEMAQTARVLMETDLHATGRRNLYFTNQPNASKKDLLEFMLWRKKADDLGIRFTDEQVSELVKSEFYQRLTVEDSKAIEDGMRNKRGYSPASLKLALAEEFKVRAAQIAIMGSSVARPSARLTDAPYDYYKLYQELCSTGRYGVITVPVANYLPQVTGEPTDKELRDLFSAHRTQEPNPLEVRPGFKEPRKIKIEWVEVKGDEPFYKAASEDGLKKLDAMAKIGGFLAVPLGGSLSAGALMAPAALTIPDPVVQSAYEEYKTTHKYQAIQNWYGPGFGGYQQPLEGSMNRPAHVASLAAMFAGSFATGGPAFGPPMAFHEKAVLADRRARLDTVPPTLIVPAMPGLGLPAALLPTMIVQAKATEPLPLAQVRTQLAAKTQESLTRTIATRDLQEFQKELTKLGAKSDKSEARAYADKFAKDRGLTLKQSADFRGQFTIHEDAALKPLLERFTQTAGGTFRQQYVNPVAFGGRFFVGPDGRPSTVPYQADFYPYQTQFSSVAPSTEVMAWRVADKEAETPRTLEDPGARDKVLAAWREQKARELAKKAAEDLAKQCENLGDQYFTVYGKLLDKRAELAAKFADAAAKDRVRIFEQDDVAALVTAPSLGVQPRSSTGPFALNPRDELPYPTSKMADELVKAKDKPISSTLVMADQPEDTFYVAVLTKRSEVTVDDFSLKIFSPFGEWGDLGSKVSLRHQAELRKQSREQAVALLKAEYRYEKESEKVGEKIESSSDD